MKDYTGKLGSLFVNTTAEWKMFSFETPSSLFWNGVANALKEKGYSEVKIKEWLQSKEARWLMDVHGEEIERLGYELIK